MGADRYNIEAKVEDPQKATEDQLLQMLQALLVERFSLKYHRESVDMPGFALVVSAKGPKLSRAKDQELSMSFGGGVQKPNPEEAISLHVRGCSMARLANLLTQMSSGPVTDKTGLEGVYDFELNWDENAGPALSTALQQQLGLRLESQKVPVSMFVIESARKPAGN